MGTFLLIKSIKSVWLSAFGAQNPQQKNMIDPEKSLHGIESRVNLGFIKKQPVTSPVPTAAKEGVIGLSATVRRLSQGESADVFVVEGHSVHACVDSQAPIQNSTIDRGCRLRQAGGPSFSPQTNRTSDLITDLRKLS